MFVGSVSELFRYVFWGVFQSSSEVLLEVVFSDSVISSLWRIVVVPFVARPPTSPAAAASSAAAALAAAPL